jgi:hypothetical protein
MIGQAIDFLWCGSSSEDVQNYVTSWTHPQFIGLALWETFNPHENLTLLVDLFNQKNVNVVLILNSWCQQYQEQFNQLKCHVLYFDFFVWRTYNELVVKKKSAVSTQWNSTADKFLFLTGKPQKANRIRLLYKFKQQGLLDRCVWSLFVHAGNCAQSHECVNLLSRAEFQQFVIEYSRNPDAANINIQPSNLHYGGIPYDVNLFRQTKFRVISETYTNQTVPWFTEKTWITILNRLPFIIAGDTYSNQSLRAMGFRTFEHYVPKLNYDTTVSIEQRLDAIVEHTKYWLEYKMDETKIAQDIEHNYNHLITLAIESKNKLEQSLNEIGITPDIDNVISTLDCITNT